MIRDKNVEWLERRELLLAQHFQTYVTGASVSDGDPVFQEIGTTGITGIQIAAAGDAIATIWMPSNVDRSKQIRFRVWWSQSSVTATDTVDWLVTYTAVVEESTVLVNPATVLSTAVPLADASSGTANQIQMSDFGIITRNTLPATIAALALKVEADAIGTFLANEVSLLGLEIRYTPREMSGPEKNLRGGRRLATATPLGVALHAVQEG